MFIKGLVSIIIPTYNGDKFIKETINSCLEQEYKNIEIIVVDDGSQKADMKAILAKYIEEGSIKYIYQQNKGLSGARNTGMDIAKGEFIQFLDDDDILERNKLKVQVDFLNSKEKYFGVYCKTIYFDNDEKKVLKILDIKPKKDIYKQLLRGNFISVHSMLLRTTEERFDESLKSLEDYDFWLRHFNNGRLKLGFLEETACYVRVHGNNMSGDFQRMAINEIKVLEKCLEFKRNLSIINYRLYKFKKLVNQPNKKELLFLIKRPYYIFLIFLFLLKQTFKKKLKSNKNFYMNKK